MPDNPDKKWAGKYANPEELEKGYSELMKEIARVKDQGTQALARADALDRYNKQLEGALTQVQANPGPKVQARALVDDDGRLDEGALAAMIDAQLKPMRDQMASVPKVIQETLGGLLAPVQRQVAASSDFWAQEEVEKAKFSQAEMRRYLNENEKIKKAYDALLLNPDTAEQAYNFAFESWKSTRPPAKSGVDEERKRRAGQPSLSAGPPAQTPEDEGSWKRIKDLEAQAAQTRDPGLIQAALGERFRGTKLMEDLQQYAEEHGYKP